MATHWKKLMEPKDMLFAYDLDGRDVTVTIERVVGGELTGEQGRKTKKPIAHLKGTTKKLALNNTNCATLEQLTGTADVEQWSGERVTLFPTTTSFGGKTVECIRIRPYLPKAKESNGKGGRSRGSDDAESIRAETDAAVASDEAQDDADGVGADHG